jgi:hypothetical protein
MARSIFRLDAENFMELQDRLGTVILDAIKKEPATATERWQALMRIGQIADAYKGSNEQTIEAVFGSVVDNLLEHDTKNNSVGNLVSGDGAH